MAKTDEMLITIKVPRALLEDMIADGRLVLVSADTTVRTPEEVGAMPHRSAFAAIAIRELAGAEAHADAVDARPALYRGSADPGLIVGLADFLPNSDTPKDGDTDGSDPNAG